MGEGFPLAAPSTSVLQTTRRFTRYWALRQQVGLCVMPMPGLTAHGTGHPYSSAVAAGLQGNRGLRTLCCVKGMGQPELLLRTETALLAAICEGLWTPLSGRATVRAGVAPLHLGLQVSLC